MSQHNLLKIVASCNVKRPLNSPHNDRKDWTIIRTVPLKFMVEKVLGSVGSVPVLLKAPRPPPLKGSFVVVEASH